jgi:hypothetical protein
MPDFPVYVRALYQVPYAYILTIYVRECMYAPVNCLFVRTCVLPRGRFDRYWNSNRASIDDINWHLLPLFTFSRRKLGVGSTYISYFLYTTRVDLNRMEGRTTFYQSCIVVCTYIKV